LKRYMRKANLYIEKIRALLQISVDKKYIPGEINEAGKMIGGWIKSYGEQETCKKHFFLLRIFIPVIKRHLKQQRTTLPANLLLTLIKNYYICKRNWPQVHMYSVITGISLAVIGWGWA
jgi:hypothetical protein